MNWLRSRATQIYQTIGLIFLGTGLIIFGYGAFTVEQINSRARSAIWELMQTSSVRIERITFVVVLVAFCLLIILACLRNRPTQNSESLVDSNHSNNSLWESLPFGSLVFFLVGILTLCDLAHSAEIEDPAKLLLRLGIYLAGALVTAIVVLYGAHLVHFEGNVRNLTRETGTARDVIRTSAETIGDATIAMAAFAKDAKALTKTASETTNLFSNLEADAGMAVLALRTDMEYRDIARNVEQSRPQDAKLDTYIRARSCHAIASDEAVYKNADQTPLLHPQFQFPVARNMISSFLEEMAWDLSQRRLVTNSHNYTSFLVSAARGFEEACRDQPKLRVFYLTHTVVLPAHLLNWPRKLMAEETYRLCEPTPFMLEYMTYCRYFACKPQRFIHARLISTQDNAPLDLVKEPFIFPYETISTPAGSKLPTMCNTWGIPCWSKVTIDGEPEPLIYHRSGEIRTAKPDFPFSPALPDNLIPHVFAAYKPTTTAPDHGIVIKSNKKQPHTLHWPLFYSELPDHGTGALISLPSNAGDEPDFSHIADRSISFLENLCEKLLSGLNDNAARELVQRGYGRFVESVRLNAKQTRNTVDAADSLLVALESFQSFRWAFKGNDAVIAWEDLRTTVFVLLNVLLSQAQNKDGEGLVDFHTWFSRTFHSCPDLGLCYKEAELLSKHQFCDLRREEFALIGVLELADANSPVTRDLVIQCLNDWRAQKKEAAVKEIMGLKSKIKPPWKHAEMEWVWKNGQGSEVLTEMVDFYVNAMETSRKIKN